MRFRTAVGLVAIPLLMLTAGCSSAADDEPTPPAETSAEAPAPPADGELGEPETTSFSFATGGVGFSWTGIMSTIAQLNEDGWDIKTPELSASELQVEGTARGEFQMSAGATNAVMLAVQAGQGVEMISTRIQNEWTLYAKAEIDSCEKLDGATLAIHSEGSPATYMVNRWIRDNCPEIKPNYVIMPGSENRYAALLAGEIDASPIELSDAITLEGEGGDAFGRLTSFAEDLPNLTVTNVYGNPEWMAENPNTVKHFLAALITEYQKYEKDPAYLQAQAEKHIEGLNAGQIEAVAKAYSEMKMFIPDGGIPESAQQFTIDFFVDAGLIEEGIRPEDAFNRSYLEAALASL